MVDLKGSIDLSPGWYQQGHGVSQLLKAGREQNGMQQWVDQMSKFHALLSRTLTVMHPHAQQWQDTDMSSILPMWNSVYNSMSIMVNCTTPYHTDVNGWQQWLDMLIMVGNYPPLDFVITTLNLWLQYNPGTIIAMPGSVLEHGVGYADGNCTCLAYYMWQNVHESVGIPLCNPPHISNLQL
ncbi:hypothetical protein EDD17DRAFT_1481306 [Pisolithus thermaeus]|nr:hypothetical protein EDD17DRAFT_1481306 [Pisolithus thermaeus]